MAEKVLENLFSFETKCSVKPVKTVSKRWRRLTKLQRRSYINNLRAKLFSRLLFLFIVVPLIDLFLLMWLSKYMGLGMTIGLVILTGIIGATLARQQGTFVKNQIRERLARQQMPTDLLSDGAMILFAAGLLLTPGLLTDLLGFSLLIPSCRTVYKRVIGKTFKSSFHVQTFQMPQPSTDARPHDPNIIEGEVVDRHEP